MDLSPTGTCARRTRSGARSAACRELYEKYAGHDNNRDFYAHNLAETRNMNRVMYREWFPQIVMNHHQTGPAGAVMFIPPCRDPFNYNIHPLVINGIERGQRGHGRAVPGREQARRRRSAPGPRYSTWCNGGLSTTCQFHNMIGLFTETIGGPTPSRVPLIAPQAAAQQRLPVPDRAAGVALPAVGRVLGDGATGRFSTSPRATARGCCTTSGVMGKNAIDRGNRDSWTDHAEDRGRRGVAVAAPRGRRRRLAVAAAAVGGGGGAAAGRVREGLPRPGKARRPRLHPARGSARLPHRDEVRQHAHRHGG